MQGNYRDELVQVAAVALAAAQVDFVGHTDVDTGRPRGVEGARAHAALAFQVARERQRQEAKFGTRTPEDVPPHLWLVILLEEVGEVADEILAIWPNNEWAQKASALGAEARAMLDARVA